MDKVVAEYNTLLKAHVAPATRDQQLRKTIQGISDFKQSGLSVDGTVWGRFQDNSYYMFNDHDVPDSFSPQSAPSLRPVKLPNIAKPGAGGGPNMVDGSNATVLDVFDGSMGTPNSQITKMLTKRGYNVTSTTATLPTLRSMSNMSVLYWSSHGGQANNYLRPANTFWAVWTATPANATADGNNYQDLVNGRLVIFDAPAGQAIGPFKDIERRYAITASWVTYYGWSFTTHSTAFINCCWSDAGGFCAALRSLSQPAGITYGWSNAANPANAWRAAGYFFDRTLGTDIYPPKMPGGLRPFSCDTVFGKMEDNGYNSAGTTQYGPSNLIENGHDILLAPSVANMDMYDMPYPDADPQTTLIINGNFGSLSPQTVDINGASVPFKYVSNTEIDAYPPGSASAAGYSGGVQIVTSKGIKGNAAPLTSWAGTFEYDANPFPHYITGKITMSGSYRADIHKYRTEVDGELQMPTPTYDRISLGTTMNWVATGTLPDMHDVTPQSGSESYSFIPGQQTGYILDAQIDRASSTFSLAFVYLGASWKVTYPPAPVTATLLIEPDPKLESLTSSTQTDKFGFPIYPQMLLGTMNNSYGTPKTTFEGEGYKADGAQFVFPAITPQFAPTDNAEEDIS